jgi:hypothetical protein
VPSGRNGQPQGRKHEIHRARETHRAMSTTDFVRCSECRAMNEPRALFCSRCGSSLYGRSPGGTRLKSRRVTAAGAAMGVALLLILAVVVFVLYVVVQQALEPADDIRSYEGQSGTTATVGTVTTEKASGDATTGSTNGSILVRPTSVSSSSALKATSTGNYRATNLVDGDTTTAWNEGAEGPGLGEWVKFEFSQQLVLERIEIANGYQKDKDRFLGNPRVQSLEVEYSNGTIQLVDLLDTEEPQTITPTRQAVEWVKFTIVSVYEGDVWEDTALSEVRIYAQAD